MSARLAYNHSGKTKSFKKTIEDAKSEKGSDSDGDSANKEVTTAKADDDEVEELDVAANKKTDAAGTSKPVEKATKKAFPADFVEFLKATLRATEKVSETWNMKGAFTYSDNAYKKFAVTWASMAVTNTERNLAKNRKEQDARIEKFKADKESEAEG